MILYSRSYQLHTIIWTYPYSKCIIFNFLIYRFRSSRRSTEGLTESTSSLTSKTWLLLVVHSNLTCYLWITYYVIDNVYGCTKFFGFPSDEYDPRLRAASISGIGVISLGEWIWNTFDKKCNFYFCYIYLNHVDQHFMLTWYYRSCFPHICCFRNQKRYVLPWRTNDTKRGYNFHQPFEGEYYERWKISMSTVKSQISLCKLDLNYHHPLLQSTNPEMNIILKSHVRLTDHGHQLYDGSTGRRVDISYVGYAGNPSAEDWQRPKKAFEPSNW